LSLVFAQKGQEPEAAIAQEGPEGPRTLYHRPMREMTMLQIGALMDAEDLTVLERLEERKQDLTVREVVGRLGRSAAYQNDPIPVIED